MSSPQRQQPVQSPRHEIVYLHSGHRLLQGPFFLTESYWWFLSNIILITNICYIVASVKKWESLRHIIVGQWKLPLGSIHSFHSLKIACVPVIRYSSKSLCILLCSGNVACWPPARPELLQRFSGVVGRELSNRNKILFFSGLSKEQAR